MVGQRKPQIGAIGGGEQLIGPNGAECGMLPSRQRLDPGDPACGDRDLRLEQHIDLAAFDRAAQIDR